MMNNNNADNMGGGEVLRLSFGCTANSVSSDLVNLEGLACTTAAVKRPPTSSSCNSVVSHPQHSWSPLCDPYITHHPMSGDRLFTPRCIFVDTQEQQVQQQKQLRSYQETEDLAAWSGPVETMCLGTSSNQSIVGYSPAAGSYNSNASNNQQYRFQKFHQIAQTLAETTYSSNSCSVHSSQVRYDSSNNHTIPTNRHVEWDISDEEGDYDDADAEDNTNAQRRLAVEKHKQQQLLVLQDALSKAWDEGVLNYRSTAAQAIQIHWSDYLLPPLPPPQKFISLPSSSYLSSTIPHTFFPNAIATTDTTDLMTTANTTSTPSSFSSLWDPQATKSSIIDSHLAGYSATANLLSSSWREDVLFNELRKSLEQCDLLQGTQLVVSNVGFYTGLATSVLEELADECKSAARWTILISDTSSTADHYEPTTHRQLFRRYLNGGLALHSLSENSDLTLPLSISSCSSFTSNALLAVAVENATIPYRLLPCNSCNNSSSDAIFAIAASAGLGSSSNTNDDSFFSLYKSVNFREFLSCLRGPTTRHSILGMDATTMKDTNLNWNQLLIQGTSVVVDPRMRDRKVSKKDVSTMEDFPGRWLSTHLHSLSYNTSIRGISQDNDYDQHTHYALHASFRRSYESYPSLTSSYQKQKYRHPLLHGIMEGIATHARPMGSFSTCLVPQSVAELTLTGGYWKSSILNSIPDFFVSTISNSTRIHPLIEGRYKSFKNATSRFCSERSSINGSSGSMWGLYTTDLQAGLAPEFEDCEEAREYLRNLDALYCPSYK